MKREETYIGKRIMESVSNLKIKYSVHETSVVTLSVSSPPEYKSTKKTTATPETNNSKLVGYLILSSIKLQARRKISGK
jgi:hypothetical protein